jgi:uncharacterized membrane protein YesL
MHIGSNDSMAFCICDGTAGWCRIGMIYVVRRVSNVNGRIFFFLECYAVQLHTPNYSMRFSLTRLIGSAAITYEVSFIPVCSHFSAECWQWMRVSLPFTCSYSRSTPRLTTPIVGLTGLTYGWIVLGSFTAIHLYTHILQVSRFKYYKHLA